MVEVFLTDIQEIIQAKHTVSVLEKKFPNVTFHVDLADAGTGYPCRHAILRAEGPAIDATTIRAAVNELDVTCEVLEDKICN